MADADALVSILISHIDAPASDSAAQAHEAGQSPPQLEALKLALSERREQAQTAWPTLPLDRELFVRHLAMHLSKEGDVLSALREVRADDLFLACACAERLPAAILALDRQYIANNRIMPQP